MQNNNYGNGKQFTSAGTDIGEVKRRNQQPDLVEKTNPQQVKEEIAQEAGPFGQSSSYTQAPQSYGAGKTASGTDIQKVREEIAQEAGPFNTFTGPNQQQQQPAAGKTVTGTDIAEVKRQNQQAEQGKNRF
jgi:hypothetical protein